MARPNRRAIVATIVAAVVAAVAVACGGGGGGEDLTGGLTPQELLDRSAQEAAGAESFRIGLEASGRIDLTDAGAIPGGDLLAGNLDISGEGPVQPPDRASLDLRIGLAGPTLQGNVTRVDDQVFVGVLGQEFRVNLPPAQVALLDLSALYPTLVSWAADPVDAGREEIDGVSVAKVTASLDPESALSDLGPLLQIDGLTPAKARAAVTEGTLEAWIGTEDLLPRRVHLVLEGDATDLDAGVGAIDIDLTADLSAYGEPVDIQAPRNAQVLDLDQLGSFAGG